MKMIKPTKAEEARLRAEAERLLKSEKMPSLETVLKALEEARTFIPARRARVY
jgi:hypothetical protein